MSIMKTSIIQSKIQLLIVDIYFIFYGFQDGFFKQSALLAVFYCFDFNLKKKILQKK